MSLMKKMAVDSVSKFNRRKLRLL